MKPVVIDKETIAGLQFPGGEVLSSELEIELRLNQAKRALLLGNTYKSKVRIIFEDNLGTKQVETTIWGLTEKRIILKKGLTLPLHRIHQIIT